MYDILKKKTSAKNKLKKWKQEYDITYLKELLKSKKLQTKSNLQLFIKLIKKAEDYTNLRRGLYEIKKLQTKKNLLLYMELVHKHKNYEDLEKALKNIKQLRKTQYLNVIWK